MAYSPYVLPEIYEVAFSFRDYGLAVDFLQEAARKAGLRHVRSMVELGCGPGQYCREFARRRVKSYGVDLSPEMVAYTRRKCAEEKLDCTTLEEDFRQFKLPHPVDLAVCMMATFGYLLSNDDILAHFDSVADNLVDQGIYIAELPHPRDVFDSSPDERNFIWDIEKDGLKVHTEWGIDRTFDPITEVDSETVKMTYEKDGRTETVAGPDHIRNVGYGLIRALIRLSNRFEIAAAYGDINVNQPFDNSKKAWRMILVLRKIT
ncbi:MAG: class I SAM-dependent methyltransferase [candidate division Zixibacteria bacterium]|nr:class I SAM-dependent methyltransferase [candidate division Zixibacteria bacterium]